MADVRYCTTEDGVRIAYSVEGQGPPLVVCPYFYESYADDEPTPQWRALMEQLRATRQVIRYCIRGTGLSQRDVPGTSLRETAKDLEAVVSAMGLEPVDLLGWAVSGGDAIAYAAGHPHNVRRLILYATWARLSDLMPKENLMGLAAMCRNSWEMASQIIADMSSRREAPDLGLRLAETHRQNMSGETLATFMETAPDVTGLLPAVRCPTLIIHRVGDTAVPFAAAQTIASGIPNARLVALKGTVNYPGLGDTQAIADAIIEFLNEGREKAQAAAAGDTLAGHVVRTILFTDVVGHTAMMRRLGDAGGREVLREHERITREVLKEHGGAEVKTMGDGFMASFASVTGALECAIDLQRAFGDYSASVGAQHAAPLREPIQIRIGLNAGEPIEDEGDLFGEMVILAARIAAQAEGGEVLASLAVRELCAGKGFLFADRGEMVMRGFEDPVRVFQVRWQD
ncbi:MAG TPA: adenylate/guanylate cyclase domain-containing protein [Dehalococcoidia bacterium]|nr:adenylate/guanylate cyclase domain-containing protein [Dehalococcoidia bacterium]